MGSDAAITKRCHIPELVFVTGLTGMFGQILLLRELMINFYGNELIIGLIIANWLLFESAGALTASRYFSDKKISLLVFLIFLYSLTLPAAIYYSRGIGYRLFDMVYGETGGLAKILLSSVIIISVPAFLHGTLFPVSCSIYFGSRRKNADSTGTLYLYETAGTLLAGIMFSVYLARTYNSMILAFSASVINIYACILFLKYISKPKMKYKIFYAGMGLMLVLTLILIFPLTEKLHSSSVKYQWNNQNVIHYQNTRYGNVVILENNDEYTFYYDGRIMTTVPLPNTALIKDYVDILFACHYDPKSILLIGSGLGGMLNEILRHPVKEVTYVELDPNIPEIFLKYPSDLIKREIDDKRTTVVTEDGRLFVSKTDEKFDIILLGFITPENLQTNRLFTAEFFDLISDRLKPDGLFGLTLPGSDIYMGEELIRLNSSIYFTLSGAFREIFIVPGELNIYISSSEHIEASPHIMDERLSERGLGATFINKRYLEYRLDPLKREMMENSIQSNEDVKMNFDFFPVAMFYALLNWGREYSPEYIDIFVMIERLHIWHLLGFFFMLYAALFLIKRKIRITTAFIYSYGIFTTGVVAMGIDMLILMIFQSIYGVLAQMVGLLMGVFLAGMLIGAYWILKKPQVQKGIKVFWNIEILIMLLLICLYFFSEGMKMMSLHVPAFIIITLTIIFSLTAGACTGAQFPAATGALMPAGEHTGKTGGMLYAADLLGGWAGGMTITVILFPLFGLFFTLVLLTLLKLSSFLMITLKGAGYG